jgi:hypothetical protein
MDYILDSSNKVELENPIKNKIWNNIVLNTIIYGSSYNLNQDEVDIYNKIFNINIRSTTIEDIYFEIYWNLMSKYNIIYNTSNVINRREDEINMQELNIYTDEYNVINANEHDFTSYYFKPKGIFSELTLKSCNKKLELLNLNNNIVKEIIKNIETFKNIEIIKLPQYLYDNGDIENENDDDNINDKTCCCKMF